MFLGLAVGAIGGGILGSIAGTFTVADLATSAGFLYRGLPVIFIVTTLMLIVNSLSLRTTALRAGIRWLLLILAGVVVGGLVGLIGGTLAGAGAERTVWMWIKADWGAALGMLLATTIEAISMRKRQ